MSVTFLSDAPQNRRTHLEACLCAQMCPDFMEASVDMLRGFASPTCLVCGGTGVEKVVESDGPVLNLNSANGSALLEMMGFSSRPHGCVDVHRARRGVIRARSRADLSQWCRPALEGPRAFSPAFNEHDLRERVDRFADFLEQSIARGARNIVWG